MPRAQSNRESGSILLLTILLLALLVGVVSFSSYIGQMVQKKQKLQDAVDLGALAAAGHGAQGLNMISANNLALGASLHVAASVPILATYASLVYAFSQEGWAGFTEVGKELANNLSLGTIRLADRYQLEVWNRIAVVPSIYLRIASGLTSYNRFLAKHWLAAAPLKGLEITRLNYPTAISVAINQRFAQTKKLGYGGLKVLPVDKTLCHSLKTSAALNSSHGNDFWRWLGGPLASLGENPAKLYRAIGRVTGFVERWSPAKIGFVGCGYGLKSSLLKFLKGLGKIPELVASENVLAGLFEKLKPADEVAKAAASSDVSGSNRFKQRYRKNLWGTKVPTKPWCLGEFKRVTETKRLELWAATGAKRNRLNQAVVFKNSLATMKKQAAGSGGSPFYCYDSKLEKHRLGHLPVKLKDSECLDLRTLDPKCALKEFIPRYSTIASSCRHITRKVTDWKTKLVRFFKTWSKQLIFR